MRTSRKFIQRLLLQSTPAAARRMASGREQNGACRDALVRASPAVGERRSRAIALLRAAAGESPGITGFSSKGARHRTQQFLPEQGFVPWRGRRKIDGATDEVRVFCTSLAVTRWPELAPAPWRFISRPTGCAPRVTISIRSFAVGLVSSIACVNWSKGPVPISTGSVSEARPESRDRRHVRELRFRNKLP